MSESNAKRTGVRVKPQAVDPVVRFANYRRVEAGATWGPRRMPDLELILIVDGLFAYEQEGGEPVSLRAGHVLAICPAVLHRLWESTGSRPARFSCIHAELQPGREWRAGHYVPSPVPPVRTDTHMDPVLHELFQRCAAEFEGFHPYRDHLLGAILREIWLRLNGYWKHPPPRRPTRRLAAMTAYIRRHLGEPLTRRQLAQQFHLTPQHVNALFRRELGTTPGAFIRLERIRAAYRLLHDEGVSVKEAAAQTGFADPFHFSRVFKQVTGTPPGRLRTGISHLRRSARADRIGP